MVGESSAARYAIYFCPDGSDPLWQLASAVIGYDAIVGRTVEQIVPPGWTARDWHNATSEPRRYGFHATLKAPFHLACGMTEPDLLDAVSSFASRQTSVATGRAQVAVLDSFVALIPIRQAAEITALAASCVATFEPFRAPLSAEDRARRKPELLDDLGRCYLDRYGYPYVLDRFRLHMTLSGSLDESLREQTRDAIAGLLDSAIPAEMTIDRIAVFRQADRASPFTMLEALSLTG